MSKLQTSSRHRTFVAISRPEKEISARLLAIVARMSEESEPKTSEERAWQYFLQLQPSIADVNAAAELAFRAVDAFDRVLKRRRAQDA
jgi:hypothetical protein